MLRLKNHSGNEIGPFRAIEESTLAQLTPTAERSDVFAWYTLIGTMGTAAGTLTCGWAVQQLQSLQGWGPLSAYRFIFLLYALLGLLKLILAFLLGVKCEADPLPPPADQPEAESEPFLGDDDEELEDQQRPRVAPSKPKKSLLPSISPSSRLVLLKLCLLFALDSLGSGLVPAYVVRRKNKERG